MCVDPYLSLVLFQNRIIGAKEVNKISAVSLFTGAGGMDVGFSNAGFRTVWANDIDKDACDTFKLNHESPVFCGDIDEMLSELSGLKNIGCVFGGPPCQGFSVAGKMDAHDPRSKLVMSFMRAVDIIQPECFVMENVKALAQLSKFEPVRCELFKMAEKSGYRSALLVLNSKDFGVPQNRERMFFIGFRSENDVKRVEAAIKKYQYLSPTVGEIIRPLGRAGNPNNSRVCNARITNAAKPVLRKSPYAGMMFNGQGRPINPNGYASTIAASMGGNRTPIIDEEHLYDGSTSYVETYHNHLMNGGEPKDMHDVPSRLRRLTIDEALLIQTFPSNYVFVGKNSSIWRQIGNAVPCKLAQAVAAVVLDVLTGKTINVQKSQTELSLNS